jgi:hypothetical protein
MSLYFTFRRIYRYLYFNMNNNNNFQLRFLILENDSVVKLTYLHINLIVTYMDT